MTTNPRRRGILESNIALFRGRLKLPAWKKEREKLKYEICMMEKELAQID